VEFDRLLADWGGSAFAAVSIVCLFWKHIGYWYASLGANALWFYLFVESSTFMVAGLQVSYALFALYGIARWQRERNGGELPSVYDHVGTAIALGIFALTIAASSFADWPSYVEFAAVALSIFANWLTAMKVIWCWPVWMATNVLFAVLFAQNELWGLFTMQFVFFALSVLGWRTWLRQAPVPVPRHA
jgi:nicotinamide mononucleotide transporter